MTQVPLDQTLAQRAAEIAIENRLRGADAVYAAVAEDFDAVLISWDEEKRRSEADSSCNSSLPGSPEVAS